MESLPATPNLPPSFIEEMENAMSIIEKISILAGRVSQDKAILDNLVSQVSSEHAKLTTLRDQVIKLKQLSLPDSTVLADIKSRKEEIHTPIAALQKELSELEDKERVHLEARASVPQLLAALKEEGKKIATSYSSNRAAKLWIEASLASKKGRLGHLLSSYDQLRSNLCKVSFITQQFNSINDSIM
ncbi:hypothetical protein Fmac_017926 [Flemingia macrophylla]|uniref:Uncharacterized protein n=1 Tax=Flemingia macrophylla TaxID=520843 RepID=A0ABD1M3F9_9FABA